MTTLRKDLEGLTRTDRCKHQEDISECPDLKTVAKPLWKAQCKECGKGPDKGVSPFTSHIMKIYRLARGGYPFEANDLTVLQWEALGVVKNYMEPRMF